MTLAIDAPAKEENVKLLPAPMAAVKALLAEQVSGAESVFSITALYGGEASHAEAIRITEFVSDKLGPDMDVQVGHWAFQELQHLRPGVVTTELAEQTQLLVLVTDEQEDLPVSIRRWIATWLQQAQPCCALVYLVGSSDGCCPVSATHWSLRKACEEARISFFVTSFPCERNPSARQCCPAQPSLSTYDCLSRAIHWGINE